MAMLRKFSALGLVAVLVIGLVTIVVPSALAGELNALLAAMSSEQRVQPYRDPALGDVDVYDNVKDIPDAAVFKEAGEPLPAMQPVTRDNKWMNKYGWHDLGLAG